MKYMLQHEYILKNMLSERSQSQKAISYMISFIWNIQVDKSLGRLMGGLGLEEGWKVTPKGYWVSFGDCDSVLLYNFVMAIECGEYIKNHWIIKKI